MARKALVLSVVAALLGLLVTALAFIRNQNREKTYEFPFQIVLEDRRSQAWNGGTAEETLFKAPAPFNHYQHAIDLKIDCIRCHHGQQAHSPAEDLKCGRCHTEPGLFDWRQKLEPQPRLEAPAASEVQMPFRMRYLGTAHHTLCIECHQTQQQLDPATKAPLTCQTCHRQP